jgi:hypothetical protein
MASTRRPVSADARARRVLLVSLLVLIAAPAAAQRTHAIDGVVARGEQEQCARRDDPRARAAWERLRARYDTASDTLSLWSAVNVATGVVPPSRLGQFDTVPAGPPHGYTDRWDSVTELRDALQHLHLLQQLPAVGSGRRGASGTWRADWAARIARGGYAARTGSSDLGGAYEAWEYPPLEAEMADHFLSDVFGRMTRFSLVTEEGTTRLVFCARPREGEGTALVGSLVLGADGSLASARWRFLHHQKSEEAGGSVAFASPASAGAASPLLAVRGFYFRRQGGEYFQRRMTFAEWHLGGRSALPATLSAGPVTDLRPGVDAGPRTFARPARPGRRGRS